MKSLSVLLVLLAVFGLSITAPAAVTTHSGSLDAGWNLIALPGIPLDPAPPSVFGSIPIDYRLFRWDPISKGLIAYDELDPEFFGNMLLSEGYWLNAVSSDTFSYSGLDDTDSMDIWISLPKAGWTLIGHPFGYEYPWQNGKVTDGNATLNLTEASQYGANWLCSVAFYWDSSQQGLCDLGLPDDLPTAENMFPGHGYWVQSNIDKIALILEAIPQ